MVAVMKKDMLLATCFGMGKLPWAPGTWASLPPVVMYQVLGYLGPTFNVYVMGLFVVTGTAMYLGGALSARRSLTLRAQRQIVADKLAGQGLTMFIITLLRPIEICNSMALGFALFRLVDVIAVELFERHSGADSGLRILMTTLASGAFAGILSIIVIHMLPVCFV
jgi:phosphatidylglycerophosphatase A